MLIELLKLILIVIAGAVTTAITPKLVNKLKKCEEDIEKLIKECNFEKLREVQKKRKKMDYLSLFASIGVPCIIMGILIMVLKPQDIIISNLKIPWFAMLFILALAIGTPVNIILSKLL